ncbi:MAG: hypothetical protein ACYDHY_17285 [Acidiferrobacterales bacterium]
MNKKPNSNTGLDGLEHLVKCLRQYARTDHHARQRRDISRRQIDEALGRAGNFLSAMTGGGSIASVASGDWLPSNREEIASSVDLLKRLDQHMENVARIHRMMVDAIRDRACEMGMISQENLEVEVRAPAGAEDGAGAGG